MVSKAFLIFICAIYSVICATSQVDDISEHDMHPQFRDLPRSKNVRANEMEAEIEYWRESAQERLRSKLQIENSLNTNRAKNIIMFLGDGMSLPTVAATRMYMGGEEEQLSFEKFPHFGLSKTYCVDRQVADSACTATAYLHGVKGNYGTIGVNAQVPRYDCLGETEESKRTVSIAKWAQDNCKATGIVTTSRVTHASPAGVYAHTANRDWENDQDVTDAGCHDARTRDIALQLIEDDVGRNLKVVMGGGRREFRDRKIFDEEGETGFRNDGRDLIDEWLAEKRSRGNASYIWSNQGLKAIDHENTDYLLGLFEPSHCLYNIEIEQNNLQETEPSLSEMTEAAIKVLQKEENGYFLFVESARIDLAHHDTLARIALDETKEFSKTIDIARRMTSESDTLIVVTSDHAHVMSYNGYPRRGNDILGLSGRTGSDSLPYTTLSYGNGIGYYNTYENGVRKNVASLDWTNPYTAYMATAPRDSETHGGDDVGVYASGPWSHLFVGAYEQSNIPVAMAYAAKIGPYVAESDETCSGGNALKLPLVVMVVICLMRFMF
ncbi:alkaline phosphatase-like [Bradysia coprophila]|uniref:alkaline phosphatase-like n=1 Tax=Bradysia coprophila TaxID=38358 RepID=UPI00187D926D|nr:alkaline phosphatase-like [Bradysia coprophila]